MNAVNRVALCPDPERMMANLACEMKIISRSSVYASAEEKLQILEAHFKSHMYIVGNFKAQKSLMGGDEILFTGHVCSLWYEYRVL